ncbi:MAG: ornithine cyclodeaminase family protein [Salinirussus sp.]
MSTSLLSSADVASALDLESALAAVERTYAETARGRVVNPSKLGMHLGDDGEWPHLNAFAIDMPAYVGWLDVAGTKWAVATWDADAEPISALMVLFDLKDRRFTAVMEGMHLTGVRTALQTVVGVQELMKGTPSTIGIIGAGFQGDYQVEIIDALLDTDEIRVYDIDYADAVSLVEQHQQTTAADLVACETVGTAAECEVVVTVTDAREPVVEAEDVADTSLLVALGTYQELPNKTILGAERIIVDHREQCLKRGALAGLAERGELGPADIDATIGEVVANNGAASGDRTVFAPLGLGSLDVAVAEHVRTAATDTKTFAFD